MQQFMRFVAVGFSRIVAVKYSDVWIFVQIPYCRGAVELPELVTPHAHKLKRLVYGLTAVAWAASGTGCRLDKIILSPPSFYVLYQVPCVA